MKMNGALCFVAIAILLSCNSHNRDAYDVEKILNKTITFPDDYVELSCNSTKNLDSLMNQNIKIVSYMDNVYCSPCIVKTLKIWQEEIRKIDDNIAYIIVIHADESRKFIELSDTLTLRYPILFYDSCSFVEQNNLTGLLARNRTFLLNKRNEVMLVGEPFGKSKLTKLYVKKISELRKQE